MDRGTEGNRNADLSERSPPGSLAGQAAGCKPGMTGNRMQRGSPRRMHHPEDRQPVSRT